MQRSLRRLSHGPEGGRHLCNSYRCSLVRSTRACAMWTDDLHATLVKMAASGATTREISNFIGKTRSAIIGRARRTGVKLRDLPPSIVETDRLGIREAYSRGESIRIIAKRFDVAESRISHICVGLPRRRQVEGTAVSRSKVFKIRVLVALFSGEKQPAIGRRMGVPLHAFRWWRNEPDIVATARAIAERRRAACAAKVAAAIKLRQIEIAAHNSPLLLGLDDRNRSIFELRQAGATMEQIGEKFGFSHQRASQLVTHMRAKGLNII